MVDSSEQQMQMRQWDEFECVLSMFPDVDELQFDDETRQQYEKHVCANGPRPVMRLQYTIHYKKVKALGFGKEIPALEIAYPRGYPAHDAVEFTVRCPFLSRQQTEALHTQLTLLATGSQGDVVVLQLYQEMLDVLTDAHASLTQDDNAGAPKLAADAAGSSSSSSGVGEGATPKSVATVLGRRAIYFHHIINANKRRVVREWALELQLGGFSKIGWPGIVVVEGREEDAQEYVRRLQHLKWKQMVVRGEQTETFDGSGGVGSENEAIDAMRRLPRGFQEFPESGMSALAAACTAAGVDELFLTTMKIYGRNSETASDTSGSDRVSASKKPKSSKKPR